MLKKLLIAAGILVVLVVIAVGGLVAFSPTHCKVEREIVINKPANEVFEYASSIKKQNEWGPWFKRDPAMKQEFIGTDGTVGFISRWASENPEVGNGEQEIKRIVPNERVDAELRFKEPMESRADAFLITEPVGASQTKVRWGFETDMPRPLNVMLLFLDMDAMIGKDYEEGLKSLKTIMESR